MSIEPFTIKEHLKELLSGALDSRVFDFAYTMAIDLKIDIQFNKDNQYHQLDALLTVRDENDYFYSDDVTTTVVENIRKIFLEVYGNKTGFFDSDEKMDLIKNIPCVNSATSWWFAGFDYDGIETIVIDECHQINIIETVPHLTLVKQ